MEAKIETLKRQETNMNDKMSRLRIQAGGILRTTSQQTLDRRYIKIGT